MNFFWTTLDFFYVVMGVHQYLFILIILCWRAEKVQKVQILIDKDDPRRTEDVNSI